MTEDLESRLADSAISPGLPAGQCPKCGKTTTHDCKAVHYVLNPHASPKEIVMEWSSCKVALEINDISIGHCDHCDYLWCLECLSPLTADEGICLHWEVCAACNEETGFGIGEVCDRMQDIECQYRDKSKCPKIKRMKRENGVHLEEIVVNEIELTP